jgi:hypothetical protein
MPGRPLVFSGLLLVAGGSLAAHARQDEEVQQPSTEIMWRKLDLSHQVLDALVLEDFEAIEAYAEDLTSLGESGEWLVSDSPEYAPRAAGFRRSTAELGRAARSRDLESATRAYVDLTLACIRCHRALGAP